MSICPGYSALPFVGNLSLRARYLAVARPAKVTRLSAPSAPIAETPTKWSSTGTSFSTVEVAPATSRVSVQSGRSAARQWTR